MYYLYNFRPNKAYNRIHFWFVKTRIKLLFRLTFVKIDKKQYGRCITCSANNVCTVYNMSLCKCTIDQQYKLRLERN